MADVHDWLSPDGEPPSIPPAADAAGKAYVFRVDAAGEPSSRFRTLIEAQMEPPLTLEARIVALTDKGELLLAEAIPGYGWKFTLAGCERINTDARAA